MTRITPETASAGARLLIKNADFSDEPLIEITVLEWSPAAAAIKVRYSSGAEKWDNRLPVYGVLIDTLDPPPANLPRDSALAHGIRRLEELEARRLEEIEANLAAERAAEVKRPLVVT